MKTVLFVLTLFYSLSSVYAVDIFCRNVDDYRKIIKITNPADVTSKKDVQVAAYWKDVGEIGEEGFVARRFGHLEDGIIEAHQFSEVMFIKNPAIYSHVLAEPSAYVFGAIIAMGLRKFFQGAYLCVADGYLEISRPRNFYDQTHLQAVLYDEEQKMLKSFFRKKDRRSKACHNLLANVIW